MANLEREVGASLLLRTTRAVTLTEAGDDYLARVEPILAALEEADFAARGAGELRGVLRVAMSSSFGVREVIPRLPRFLDRHGALRIELGISDARQDLTIERMDVALRVGVAVDAGLRSRKLASAQRVLAASPSYLQRAGAPACPADLVTHSVILGPGGDRSRAWTFGKDGRTCSIRVEGRVMTAVNEGATAAAVAGLGITQTSVWGCRAELRRGDLVAVMTDWTLEPVELYALFPAGGAPAPAARAFVEYFADEIARDDT